MIIAQRILGFSFNFVSRTDTYILGLDKIIQEKILPRNMSSKRMKIEDQGIAEQLLAAFGDQLINGSITLKVNIIIQVK